MITKYRMSTHKLKIIFMKYAWPFIESQGKGDGDSFLPMHIIDMPVMLAIHHI